MHLEAITRNLPIAAADDRRDSTLCQRVAQTLFCNLSRSPSTCLSSLTRGASGLFLTYRSVFQFGFTMGLCVAGFMMENFSSSAPLMNNPDLFWVQSIGYGFFAISLLGVVKWTQNALQNLDQFHISEICIASPGIFAGAFIASKMFFPFTHYLILQPLPIEAKVVMEAFFSFSSSCLLCGISAVATVALWRGINHTCGAIQESLRRRNNFYVALSMIEPPLSLASEELA